MKNTRWLALILALLTALGLTGCAKTGAALTQNPWQRVEYLPPEAAEAFLSALDLTTEEIAPADLNGLGIVRTAAFTADRHYRFGCDAEATRMLARRYLDTLFTALSADTAALAPVYDEAWRVDMAAMTGEECKAFYATLFGCEDYAALLDHLAAALFDYDALARMGESGRYVIRGDKLFLSDEADNDRGYAAFALSENRLTLVFADSIEEYTPA